MAGMLGSSIECNDDCHDHHDGHGHSYRHCHDNDHHDDDGHDHQSTQVTVLVTDHPIDDVDAFLVTITEVTFLEENDGPTSVYSSDTGRRIDLLSLRGSRGAQLYDLLAVEDLPTGVYDSIQLTLRDPVIFLSSGEVLAGSKIDLAGDGRIEIDLTTEPVILEPDEPVYVILDFDVSASVVIAEDPDGSTRRDVRPVILVNVLYDDVEDVVLTPTDLRGRLTSRDPATGIFTLELPDDRGTLDFRLVARSLILDRFMNPISEEALTLGSEMRVRGYPTNTGDLEIERIVLEPHLSARETAWRIGNEALLGRGLEAGASIAVVPEPIQGIVTGVAPLDDALMILEANGFSRRVRLTPKTTIVVVEIDAEGLWQTSIPLLDVEIGMNIVVHQDAGFAARLVVVTSD